jgi:hypothetical protein
MKQNFLKNPGTVTKSLVLVLLLGVAWRAWAQEAKASYPTMVPLEQYLMADRTAEIALARSAAPPSIAQRPRSWCLGGTVMRSPSKPRTALYA